MAVTNNKPKMKVSLPKQGKPTAKKSTGCWKCLLIDLNYKHKYKMEEYMNIKRDFDCILMIFAGIKWSAMIEVRIMLSLLLSTSSCSLCLGNTSDFSNSALDFLSLLSCLVWFSKQAILININKYLIKIEEQTYPLEHFLSVVLLPGIHTVVD